MGVGLNASFKSLTPRQFLFDSAVEYINVYDVLLPASI